ncbi:hypothetical protein K438DRAFT_1750359 [Mycena galopus ATCC 62051]|nr:hypothetical protein K438DRAFT_1750359 [Mycena galopus ATCC 62051]
MVNITQAALAAFSSCIFIDFQGFFLTNFANFPPPPVSNIPTTVLAPGPNITAGQVAHKTHKESQGKARHDFRGVELSGVSTRWLEQVLLVFKVKLTILPTETDLTLLPVLEEKKKFKVVNVWNITLTGDPEGPFAIQNFTTEMFLGYTQPFLQAFTQAALQGTQANFNIRPAAGMPGGFTITAESGNEALTSWKAVGPLNHGTVTWESFTQGFVEQVWSLRAANNTSVPLCDTMSYS